VEDWKSQISRSDNWTRGNKYEREEDEDNTQFVYFQGSQGYPEISGTSQLLLADYKELHKDY